MENRGIEYRERSPLVVPPKLDLPPPAATAAEAKAPNWPKDPDEQRRKAAVAARKKDNKDPREAARVLTPAELAKGKTAATSRSGNDPVQPGVSNNPILSPSQLGYTGGFSGMFGGNKTETAPFKGEPTREFADAASGRLSDAVVELRLRHRAEGIAEQGIQPGRRQVWRIVKLISRLRDDCRRRRGVRCRGFIPNDFVRVASNICANSCCKSANHFCGIRAR